MPKHQRERGVRRAPTRRRWGAADVPAPAQHVLGQIGAQNRVAVGERARALDHVLQLADVPGPAVGFERGEGVGSTGLHASLPIAAEERLNKQRDVAGSLA